jgi:hypothetical protein
MMMGLLTTSFGMIMTLTSMTSTWTTLGFLMTRFGITMIFIGILYTWTAPDDQECYGRDLYWYS